MKSILFVFFLLICGCSSKTNVHLYAKYLTTEEVNTLISSIEKEHFNVMVNYQVFPSSISNSSLVYAPSQNSEKRLPSLLSILTNSGYSISHASLLLANNHSFTENNVGVFLVPNGLSITQKENDVFELVLPTGQSTKNNGQT